MDINFMVSTTCVYQMSTQTQVDASNHIISEKYAPAIMPLVDSLMKNGMPAKDWMSNVDRPERLQIVFFIFCPNVGITLGASLKKTSMENADNQAY